MYVWPIILCNTNKMAKNNLICLSIVQACPKGMRLPLYGCFNLTEFFMLCFCSKKVGWNSFLNYFFIAFCAKRSCSLYLINYIFLNFQNSRKTVTFCITYTYIYKPKFFIRIVCRCASPAPSVFPFDKKSWATLRAVSTWMGDRAFTSFLLEINE